MTALLWAVAIVAVAAFGWGASVVYRAHRSVVRRSEGPLSATGRTRMVSVRQVQVTFDFVGPERRLRRIGCISMCASAQAWRATSDCLLCKRSPTDW